jgi:putative membrane protein
MNGYGPTPGGGIPGGVRPGEGWMYPQHTVPWWDGVWHLVPMLLLAVLIGVLVWGILRLSADRAMVATAAPMSTPPAPVAQIDPAGQELRLGYARGDISREEYLTRSVDLGLAPGPTPEVPTEE